MSHQAIQEYLIAMFDRYQKATMKTDRSKLLTEAVLITGLHRKTIIRRLRGNKAALSSRKASGAPRRYNHDVLCPHIRTLWMAMERISPKRMKAGLKDWLPHYPEFLDPATYEALLEMSASTLTRLLKKVRKDLTPQQGLSTTCPARFMKNKVPLNTFDSKADRPGFTQADTVAHCGTSAAGKFANSITLTDIQSTWTENRAMLTKQSFEIRRQVRDIEKSLPFDLLSINTDSGSEFLNNEMINFMRGRKQPITLTRSRPYRKNDNCYVEQKNFTHVRELFGYERIEEEDLVALMNEIYKSYWNPLQNFFLPTFKLKEKVRIGSKIVKKYDSPQTPYQRLMKSTHLSQDKKEGLRKQFETLNPFTLKTGLEKKLEFFFKLLKQKHIREAA